MTYSKALDPDDYNYLPVNDIKTIHNNFRDICRFEHEQRYWEYSLALKALQDIKAKNVLEVGGGGSLLIPILYSHNINVTEIDSTNCSVTLQNQANRLQLQKPIQYIQKDFLQVELKKQFDAVVCLSVIEHVKQHNEFFQKLLQFVKTDGILILTTDFHPSGKPFSINHLRTYTEKDLLLYAKSAKDFDFFRGKPDYTYKGNYVYQYTFASLILIRKK